MALRWRFGWSFGLGFHFTVQAGGPLPRYGSTPLPHGVLTRLSVPVSFVLHKLRWIFLS